MEENFSKEIILLRQVIARLSDRIENLENKIRSVERAQDTTLRASDIKPQDIVADNKFENISEVKKTADSLGLPPHTDSWHPAQQLDEIGRYPCRRPRPSVP